MSEKNMPMSNEEIIAVHELMSMADNADIDCKHLDSFFVKLDVLLGEVDQE